MHTEKPVFQPKGFLFLGDPHVSSERIGRRKDDYTSSVLDKLSAAAKMCEQLQLLPVITGDLMHRNDDNDVRMLNRLIRALKAFPVTPIVLEGNHDRELATLSDYDVLMLLSQTGVVQLTGEGEVGQFLFEGAAEPVRLWACPYGSELPTELPAFEGKTLLLTHHDMAFGSAYPGAAPLSFIKNCDMVVNGHMHDTKESVLVGYTWWHNPGNIEPLSVDLASHIPKAWEWRPDMPVTALQGHELPHGTDLFDLAGLEVKASDADAAVAALPDVESQFVQMLNEQTQNEAAKTSDKSVLVEDLSTVLSVQNAPEAVRKLMFALAAGVDTPELALAGEV